MANSTDDADRVAREISYHVGTKVSADDPTVGLALYLAKSLDAANEKMVLSNEKLIKAIISNISNTPRKSANNPLLLGLIGATILANIVLMILSLW